MGGNNGAIDHTLNREGLGIMNQDKDLRSLAIAFLSLLVTSIAWFVFGWATLASIAMLCVVYIVAMFVIPMDDRRHRRLMNRDR